MDDRDRRQLRAVCDQFKEVMRRDVEITVFDEDACQRVGEIIVRSARHQAKAPPKNGSER